MSLAEDATLVDVAFAVCTTLDRAGIIAVLTGGSAATFYQPTRYQSLDADFVLRLVPNRRTLDDAMTDVGFSANSSGLYIHPKLLHTVEFPAGPLAIGRHLINTWTTQRRENEILHVLSVTDCVRDRFMHFWAWNDRSALETAVAVANAHRALFDEAGFRAWTESERTADRSYAQSRVEEFLGYLR